MKSIWKYEILGMGEQVLEMPKGAEILSVQAQNDFPCLWALVDTEKDHEDRKIIVYGTGRECLSDSNEFIGTIQLNDGSLVLHVFEAPHV